MNDKKSLDQDRSYMRHALALGEREMGRTWPNPAVGCVLVNDGHVIGRGWTRKGGRPHAETEALRRAGERWPGKIKGSTVYVTLEPCSNWGQTGPCAKALAEAGVARAVVGCLDPDPRVNGNGIRWMRQAGIDVDIGILEEECRRAHLGLYRRILARRPFVTLKLAQSLDGKIALDNGKSRWITNARARRRVHLLRSSHDAVMVGADTAIKDDPGLDCRIAGLENRSPVRLVLDRRARLSTNSNLMKTAGEIPFWWITKGSGSERPAGVEEIILQDGNLTEALEALAERRITRLLVEGGAQIAASFLKQQMVDHLIVMTAPKILGQHSISSVGGLGLANIPGHGDWNLLEACPIGQDFMCWFEHANA